MLLLNYIYTTNQTVKYTTLYLTVYKWKITVSTIFHTPFLSVIVYRININNCVLEQRQKNVCLHLYDTDNLVMSLSFTNNP